MRSLFAGYWLARLIATTCVFFALSDSDVWSAVVPEDDQIRKLLRLELIGPVIVTADNYTIHMPDGTPDLVCPKASRMPELSTEQREARRVEILNEQFEIGNIRRREQSEQIRRYHHELFPEYNRRHEAGEITRRELQDLVNGGMAEIKAIQQEPLRPELQARYDGLVEEQARMAGAITVYLQHAPDSPNDTIVPMTGNQPSEAFVQELSDKLMPLFESCGSPKTVWSVHYYANAFGGKYRNDQSIVTFSHRIEDGQLVYADQGGRTTGHAGVDNKVAGLFGDYDARDPAQNRELTLAGYWEVIADRQAIAEEKARRLAILAADYRKTYRTAAGRKPGVVYLLDDYWDSYRGMDYVRRIFDGDFALLDEPGFELYFNAFAEVYSVECKSFIGSFVTYLIPTRNYAGSDWHLDGSVTNYYEDGVLELKIASQFAPYFGDFRPAANEELMTRMWSRMQGSGSYDLMNLSVGEFREQAKTAHQVLAREYYEFGRFIDDRGCPSAAVEQMALNLVNAAAGQPSMQDAGVRLENASAESDPVTEGEEVKQSPTPAGNSQQDGPDAMPQVSRSAVEQAELEAVPVQPPDSEPQAPKVSQPTAEVQTAAERAAEARRKKEKIAALQMTFAEEMQSVAEKHIAQQQAEFNATMTQIQNAETDEERASLQRQLVQRQHASRLELQEKMKSLRASQQEELQRLR